MSSESRGRNDGAYGATWMTRGSWFSGNSESSRNCMAFSSCVRVTNGSVGFVADDSGALHPAHRGPVVLHGVVLGAAVVPDGDAVGRPAPADLVLGNRCASDQVAQQLRRTRREVLAVAHVLRRVEVHEVRREAADEQDLLAGLRVRAHDRML